MAYEEATLTLTVDVEADVDAEELAKVSRQLRTELMELDVDSIDPVREDESPAGAKAGDPINWGTLIVTLASSGVLTALINVLQDWLARREHSSVALEIGGDRLELKDITSKERQQLIDDWLSRHRGFVITND